MKKVVCKFTSIIKIEKIYIYSYIIKFMIQLKIKDRANRWTNFYTIDCSNGVTEDKVNYDKETDVPPRVYGKYVHFFAGYQPIWMYVTVPKSTLKIS